MLFSHEFVVLTCCNTDCGISFCVPQWWHKGKRDNHSWWYCPNGHHQHFPQDSDEEKLRRERDVARQQLARAEQETADANQRADLLQKQKRRLEKRAAAGTCPCCHRTFQNMTTHMKKQHPEFVAENVVALKKAAK